VYVTYIGATGVNSFFISQINATGVQFLNSLIQNVKDIRQTESALLKLKLKAVSATPKKDIKIRYVFTALFTNSTSNASLVTQD
jgi:hypothetical protein